MNNNELLQAMSLMMDEKFGKRFDAIENRLDNMDKRFENMDMRINNKEQKIIIIHRNIADINYVINAMEADIRALKSIAAEKTAEWMKPEKK